MSFVKRIRFHVLRYKGEILYSSIIIGVLMLMIAIAFPKDTAAIAGYVDILSGAGLDALFSTVNVDAPGWLFWVSLMGTAYLYIVSAIAAIRIGSKLYPSQEKAALELIASSPKTARMFYLENILSAVISILMILLPGFLVLVGYSLTQDAVDAIPRLGVMFILSSVVALFFVALCSLPSIFRFSQGVGSKLGYMYLFVGFLIEFTVGSIKEYEELANISVNSYVSPTAGLLSGEHNWEESGVMLAISAVLFGLSFYLVRKPDYIEKVSGPRRFQIGFLPRFSPKGRLASQFPILFDQFRKDRIFFFIWTLVVNFAFFYIAAIYAVALKDDPTILTTLTQSFGGILDAFTFGYSVPPTYVGFLTFEVFGLLWLYFGIFIFIPAINIANRDQANDEQDLIWSNSVTPNRVILSRTLGILIYFTFYYWISYGVLSGVSMLFDLDLPATEMITVFLVGYIYFSGLTFLFVALTMFFPISKGKRITLWFYIISVFILIATFLEPSIDQIRYISIVYYFDPVGLILKKIEVVNQIINSVIILIGSISYYFISLQYKYRKTDLLT